MEGIGSLGRGGLCVLEEDSETPALDSLSPPRCMGEWLCPIAHSDVPSWPSPKATGHMTIDKNP